MDYIYFCRSSFCMADDVCAPNIQRFEYSIDTMTEDKIKEYITRYLSNVSFYKWRGYCKGELVAVAYQDDKNTLIVELNDNCISMITEHGFIWFNHHDPEVDGYVIKESIWFSSAKAKEYYDKYR